MVQVPSQTPTLDQFLQLPETKPASEYIDGQVIQKPMPQGKHSKLQGKLVTAINALVEDSQTALAFPELRCTYLAGSHAPHVYGGRSIVPDVAVFAWNRIPLDDRGDIANVFEVAPDVIIEILSPDQSQTKVTKKLLHCLKYGSQMAWLIDPDDRSILVYPSGQPTFLEEPQDLLPVPDLLKDLRLTVGELFGWLKLGGTPKGATK